MPSSIQSGLRTFRYLTDANRAGVEKLAVSEIKPEMLTVKPASLSSFDHQDLLHPMSVFLVKGWSRCVAAVVLLLYAYGSPEDVLQAWDYVQGLAQ